MKTILKTICIIFALFVCVFPLKYKHSYMDKAEVKASHILVETQEEANKIHDDIITQKIKFEDAAKKYSTCPSGEDGGDLGYSTRGVLLAEFENVIFNLAPKKLSEPFQTKEGWHIAKVTDVKYFSDKKNFEKRYKF